MNRDHEHLGWRLARWAYGFFYLASGLHMLAVKAGLAPVPDFHHTGAGAAFHRAMTATGFLDPSIALGYVIGGFCLLRLRTAPLGVVLLAPLVLVLVIFLFNLLLSPTWPWGTAHLLWLLALAWHLRPAFTPLWRYG